MSGKEGNCALCGTFGPLCRSHIVPRTFYDNVFSPEVGGFIEYSLKDEDHRKMRGKGIWEYLLCAEHERQFGRYDDYAAKVVKHGWVGTRVQGRGAYILDGIEYSTFKLFQLSLLWRCGASRRAEFATVSLGKSHYTRIRGLLLDQDPGNPRDYPCLLVESPAVKATIGDGAIGLPARVRLQDHWGYQLYFAGLFWNFVVSAHTRRIAQFDRALSQEGVLLIIEDDEHGKRSLKEQLGLRIR